MDMKDRLTGAGSIILYQPETGFGEPLLSGNFSRFAENITDNIVIPGCQIKAADKMFFG